MAYETFADKLRDHIDCYLGERNKALAVQVAIDAVQEGAISVPELHRQVLVPLMVETGSRWRRGEKRVWEEHLASAAVRTIVEALYPYVQHHRSRVRRLGRVAVLACPSQEQHDLGIRMLADRLELAGWDAHFLGADVPPDELAAAAQSLGAELIVLHASTLFHRTALRAYVDRLRALAPASRVAVRGTAFESDGESWAADLLFDEDALLAEQPAEDNR